MGLNSDADKQGDHSVVSPDAVLAPGDRMLTAKESLVLERSGTVAMGKWADGDMAPQTLWEARTPHIRC
jgi:allantoicase